MFDFERTFGELQREMEAYVQRLSRPKRPIAVFSRRTWQPAVDLYETDQAVVALVDLSGVAQEEIDLVVSPNSLTVRGERTEAQDRGARIYACMEIPFGPFERTVEFSSAVDPDRTEASFSAGFLEVIMPKAGVSRPRRVEAHEA